MSNKDESNEEQNWLGDSLAKYRKYQADFAKKTYEGFSLRLKKKEDKKIILAIKGLQNKTDYVRALIEEDLKKENRIIDRFPKKDNAEPYVREDGKIWVVDKPAYSETIHHAEEGHWEDYPGVNKSDKERR